MDDYGWTWGDLSGELIEYGIDPDDVSSAALDAVLSYPSPGLAAATLADITHRERE